jgi:hypothetical protein
MDLFIIDKGIQRSFAPLCARDDLGFEDTGPLHFGKNSTRHSIQPLGLSCTPLIVFSVQHRADEQTQAART